MQRLAIITFFGITALLPTWASAKDKVFMVEIKNFVAEHRERGITVAENELKQGKLHLITFLQGGILLPLTASQEKKQNNWIAARKLVTRRMGITESYEVEGCLDIDIRHAYVEGFNQAMAPALTQKLGQDYLTRIETETQKQLKKTAKHSKVNPT